MGRNNQSTSECITRGNVHFLPTQTWELPGPLGIPASVKVRNVVTQLVYWGPLQQQTAWPDSDSFWEFVTKQGGDWMWDHVEGRLEDMSWIATALFIQSAVMVTDGSYNL